MNTNTNARWIEPKNPQRVGSETGFFTLHADFIPVKREPVILVRLDHYSEEELREKVKALHAIILLDSADLVARRTLLAVNGELGRRAKEYVFRNKPITPWTR